MGNGGHGGDGSVPNKTGDKLTGRRKVLAPPRERFAVLVVDDDAGLLTSIQAILSLDFDVVACSTPEQGLDRFNQRAFHVVCSDYLMPSMDGQTFLAEIQRRSDQVCCLLMTARDDLATGARNFPVVFKPFDPERFLYTVEHLARIAEMKRSTRALNRAAHVPNGAKTGTHRGR